MTAVPRYALWLLLPDAARILYGEIVRRLSERLATPAFEPHVTLLGGLGGKERVLDRQTQRLAESLAPFDIRLLEAAYLDEYFRALFIDVALSPPLHAARTAARRLFERRLDDSFRPHLSLLYGDVSEREKESALDDIGRYFDETLRIDRVALWRVDGSPTGWRGVRECPLTG